MTTSDWAIAISLCSVAIAVASFVWNVWSKFIYPKPRLVVSFRIMSVFQSGIWSQKHINMSIVNHGPIKTQVYCAVLQERDHPFSKPRWAILNPINDFPREPCQSHGPFSGGLPKNLEVGESLTLFFPYVEDGFLDGTIINIGVTDVFGNHHWARRKQLKEVVQKFRADFPNAAHRKAGDPSSMKDAV